MLIDYLGDYLSLKNHNNTYRGMFAGLAIRDPLDAVAEILVPELSYKALDIQEGATAQRLWMEAALDGKRPNEKEKIFNDLIEYCKLDTLAMVEIYKKLREI